MHSNKHECGQTTTTTHPPLTALQVRESTTRDDGLDILIGDQWRPVTVTRGRWFYTLEWHDLDGGVLVPSAMLVRASDWHEQVRQVPQGLKKNRLAAFVRDGFTCQAHRVGLPACTCDTLTDLTIHHLVPRAQGGSDDLDNLLTLCRACHDLYHRLGMQQKREVAA